jgi:hypothetical protein
MHRMAVALAVLALSGGALHANTLACKSYRARLEANLHRLKDVPALEVAQARESHTNPHTTYDLSGGPGLTGNLECFEADRLQEVDFLADLKTLSPHEVEGRIGQLQTLAIAASCAIQAKPDISCRSKITDLFAKTRRQLVLVTSRGDPLPEADEGGHMSSRVTFDLFEKPEAMQFSVFVQEPSFNEQP